jgi:nitrate reductase alpha subunit
MARTSSALQRSFFDENLQDIDYIKEFTDLPLLVRTDTLQYLDPRDVIADYKFPDFSKSYSGRIQSLKPEQVNGSAA